MKTKIISCIVTGIILISCASQNQVKSDKDLALIRQINEKVQSQNIRILTDHANPMRGKSIYLTSEYDLIIRNDSAISYLPYFGQAYSAPYGGGESGIKFATRMKDYVATPSKKDGEWNLRFKIDTPDYNYDFRVDIYSNGSSSIYVNSSQRQSISFTGEMELNR